MTAISRRRLGAYSAAGAFGLLLTACGGTAEDASAGSDAGGEGAQSGTVEVEDNHGTHTVEVPPASVVATDNRTFETLEAWGVTLTAAARALMPSTIDYRDDESIIDLGNHRERSEEHTSELQSRGHLVCRLLLEKYNDQTHCAQGLVPL